ncbi:MAG: FliH/SctL family protein [Burkholderiaceae bacterium]
MRSSGAVLRETRASSAGAAGPGAAPAAGPAPDAAQALRDARSQGYQDGYRDGLVALEGFKQTYALQVTTQLGSLVRSVGEQLDGLQQQMAQALAATAVQLARQIVRSELALRPELVAAVAAEALDTLLISARHVDVRVHPDDHALVAQGAGESIAARGARLFVDPTVSRGGCVVESDVGVIDAGIENRWHRAAAALGQDVAWVAPPSPVVPTAPVGATRDAAIDERRA